MHRPNAIVVVIASLTIASCSTGSGKGSGSYLNATPQSFASGNPSRAAAADSSAIRRTLNDVLRSSWVRQSALGSGTRFALPTRASARRQSGSGGIVETLYASTPHGNAVVVSFAIVNFPGASDAVAGINSWADNLAGQMKSGGASDFTVSERRQCKYRSMDCRDVRFQFTPLDHQTTTTQWLLRLVRDGSTMFVLQTIAGTPKGDPGLTLPLVRRVHARLVGSLTSD
jgi:hypothetical protein